MRQFIFLYPLIELIGYILFTSMFGIGAAFLYGLATLILGLSLLRGQGLRLFAQGMRSGGVAGFQAFNLSMFAGLLLVMPGFITDALGLLLLIPAIFQLVTNKSRRQAGQESDTATYGSTEVSGQVIEGEYQIVDKDKSNTP